AALALTLCVLAPSASAQVGNRPNIDPFRPTADIDGFLTLPGASTPGHLLGGAGLFFDYSNEALVTIDPDGASTRIDPRASARLAGMLGLGRWAALAIDVPFVMANRGPAVGSGDPATNVAR